ncbi:MAG: hypothetical protein HC869_16115 [Rhodospirillales bacterium]|nr:hypothetical protein [Rhodospirillales bacterium]
MPKRNAAPSKVALPAKPYLPTEADRRLVKSQIDRRQQSRQAPKVKVDHKPPKPVMLKPDHPDPVVGNAALHAAFGSAETNFVNQQIIDLINVLQSHPSQPVSEVALNGALATINGIKPEDEVEAMLATQMVATNHVAMDLLRRYGQADYMHKAKAYGSLAAKFLSTFTAQLEALQRYRGKGQQKIVVERVADYWDKGAFSIDRIEFANGFLDAKTNDRQINIRTLHDGGPSEVYPEEMKIYLVSGKFMFEPRLASYPFDTQRFAINIQPEVRRCPLHHPAAPAISTRHDRDHGRLEPEGPIRRL